MLKSAPKILPILLPVFLLAMIGCSGTSVDQGPSYSELVVTYNAELEALDRLESKREKLLKEFETAKTALVPPPKTGGLDPSALLEKAKGMLAEGGVDTSADPNELLDQLAERSGDAGELTDSILGLLADKKDASNEAVPVEPTEEQAAAIAQLQSEYDPKIAKLDEEIKSQSARVERAREARDAAETERDSAAAE